MDDLVKRLARELADAIAVAVAKDPSVAACREKARNEGFDVRLTLDALVGFVSKPPAGALAAVAAPTRAEGARGLEINANDRRFLRSLRISADELSEEVE